MPLLATDRRQKRGPPSPKLPTCATLTDSSSIQALNSFSERTSRPGPCKAASGSSMTSSVSTSSRSWMVSEPAAVNPLAAHCWRSSSAVCICLTSIFFSPFSSNIWQISPTVLVVDPLRAAPARLTRTKSPTWTCTSVSLSSQLPTPPRRSFARWWKQRRLPDCKPCRLKGCRRPSSSPSLSQLKSVQAGPLGASLRAGPRPEVPRTAFSISRSFASGTSPSTRPWTRSVASCDPQRSVTPCFLLHCLPKPLPQIRAMQQSLRTSSSLGPGVKR
mmetsp:Transcript_385/g.745  ORF Transcript_385/g.745 Transcript_385/m.745 type:complete len:274 (-) Transcript_385:638-1459(-)